MIKYNRSSPSMTSLSSSTALSGGFGWRSFDTLLALNPDGLPLGRVGRVLSLLRLLLAFGRGPFLLSFLDRRLAGGRASLGTLRTTFLDDVEGCTDDGALMLYRPPSSFLGNLL